MFGDRMLCWWGIWTLCLSPTTNGGVPGLPNDVKAAQRGSVVSPIFTVLLVSLPPFLTSISSFF